MVDLEMVVAVMSVAAASGLGAGFGWLHFVAVYKHVIDRWGIRAGFLDPDRRWKGTTGALDVLFVFLPMLFIGLCGAVAGLLAKAYFAPYDGKIPLMVTFYGCWGVSTLAFAIQLRRERDLYRMDCVRRQG